MRHVSIKKLFISSYGGLGFFRSYFGRSFSGFLGISCKGPTKFREPLDNHGENNTLHSSHSTMLYLILFYGFSSLKLCSDSGGVGGI